MHALIKLVKECIFSGFEVLKSLEFLKMKQSIVS